MKRALRLIPLLLLAACTGKGNTGRTDADPALVAQVPWLNGAPALTDPSTMGPVVPTLPVYPPIREGLADPGSRVKFDTEAHRDVACAALEGIELSSWQHDFEPPGGVADRAGLAQFFSAYDDKTDGSWHVPGDVAWYRGISGTRDTALWGLAADRIEGGPSCDGAVNNWALHIKGGRFNYYGGGAEHPLSLDCKNSDPASEACAMKVDAVGDGRPDQALNASSYDGVAFWARRGPDGASGLMVNLQDKYTSDRLARTDPVGPGVGYCQRIKQCAPTCTNGGECLPTVSNDEGESDFRCVPPGVNPGDPGVRPADLTNNYEAALLQQLYPPCGVNTCDPPSYDADIDYTNTQCKPYNFTGLEENYWCFGDKPPAAPDERCGDGFVSNISLSTDWQFYKLPFDRFQQVGFAKKVPPFDVPQKTLYSIAFLFSVGYTDFYVDNLSFYRNQ